MAGLTGAFGAIAAGRLLDLLLRQSGASVRAGGSSYVPLFFASVVLALISLLTLGCA